MKGRFIFFDWETDGLDPDASVPTELAMIAYDLAEGKEVGRFGVYVLPPEGHELDADVMAKTDVTPSQVMSLGRPQKEVANMIEEFVRGTTKGGKLTRTSKPTLVGHNAAFDIARMRRVLSNNRKDPAKVFATNSGEFVYLDTLQMARVALEAPGSDYDGAYNLTALCGHYGIPLFNAHGAMADTEATMRLFEALRLPPGKAEAEAGFTPKPKVKKRKPFQI